MYKPEPKHIRALPLPPDSESEDGLSSDERAAGRKGVSKSIAAKVRTSYLEVISL